MRKSPIRLLQSCNSSPVRLVEESRVGLISPKRHTQAKLLTSRSAAKGQLAKSRVLAELPAYKERRESAFRSPAVRTKLQLLTSVAVLKAHVGPATCDSVKSVMHIIETLASEKGSYEEEMRVITKELKKVIFCPRAEAPEWVLPTQADLLVERYGVPYFAMVGRLLQEVDSAKCKWEGERRKCVEISEFYEKEMKSREGKIEAQKKEIDALKQNFEVVQRTFRDLKTSVSAK